MRKHKKGEIRRRGKRKRKCVKKKINKLDKKKRGR